MMIIHENQNIINIIKYINMVMFSISNFTPMINP